MSQEYNSVPKKPRRTRSRNRPTLVVNNASAESSSAVSEDQAGEPTTTTSSTATTVAETATPASAETPAAATTRAQRSPFLPRFFSKVDKGEQDEANSEQVIEARMARARKGAVVGEKASSNAEEKPEAAMASTSAAPARPAASNRPPTLFKTRHIIGMAIYLLAAQFILPYERLFAINLGFEQKIAEFPFFGANAQITTSFLLNILTLIALLYLLVRFDFLPSGKRLAAAQGQQGGRSSANATPMEKVPPKVMREGVKGEHDELYMAYRTNQRREKKH